MTTSTRGLDLIQRFEGCRLAAYRDGAGIWTVGYGHTQDVTASTTRTHDEALADLCGDVSGAEESVRALVKVPLTQCQFDALVSFAYNLGREALRSSTLLKILNAGCYRLAADQFLQWVNVAGKPSAGLRLRRQAERALFLENDELRA